MTNKSIIVLLILISNHCFSQSTINNESKLKSNLNRCILGDWELVTSKYTNGIKAKVIFLNNEYIKSESNNGFFVAYKTSQNANDLLISTDTGSYQIIDFENLIINNNNQQKLIKFKIKDCNKIIKDNEIVSIKKNDINNILTNFKYFNMLFHSNKDFQITRLQMPLKGSYKEFEVEKKWEINNWVFHKNQVGENKLSGYKKSIKIEANKVNEKIWIQNSGYQVERIFEKIKGNWYLTTYNVMNY